jgi:mRNA interferase MazF
MVTSLKGTIVIINFPFSDLSNAKKRPALVIAGWKSNDVILCQITSIANKDEFAVELTDNDFISGSLVKKSYIRPNKLFTADKATFLDNAGCIFPEKIKDVTDAISRLLDSDF